MEPTHQNETGQEVAKLSQLIQIDEEIQAHLGEVVRSTVEETLNAMLEAEAERLCAAERYEGNEASANVRKTLDKLYKWRDRHNDADVVLEKVSSVSELIGCVRKPPELSVSLKAMVVAESEGLAIFPKWRGHSQVACYSLLFLMVSTRTLRCRSCPANGEG